MIQEIFRDYCVGNILEGGCPIVSFKIGGNMETFSGSKGHYTVHQNPPLDPILRVMSLVHTLKLYFCVISFEA
jgi:hypothetical protein